MFNTLINLDGNILLWIQQHLRHEFLTPLVIFITTLGNSGIIWIVLCMLLLISKKTRNVGLMGAIALFLSLIINNGILKHVVARTRPYEVVTGLQALIPYPTDFSFPSGHTAASFAAGVVFLKKLPKKYGVPAFVLAVFISLSRLYVGVHYPTDVIGGAISGTLIAFAACRIGEYLEKRNIL